MTRRDFDASTSWNLGLDLDPAERGPAAMRELARMPSDTRAAYRARRLRPDPEETDAWRVAEVATRHERAALSRRRWLEEIGAEPGATPTLLAPQDGEGWIEAFAEIAAELEDTFPEADAAGRRAEAIAEVASDAHGCRAECAELLGARLAALPAGPIRLDARALPLRTLSGIAWLRRVLAPVRGRPVLVALPAGWSAAALTAAERVWARDE